MFDWNKKGLIEEVKELIAKVENANEDGRWITVHPNGEDSKGVHVFVKKGQSVEEAIDKLDKKEDKKEEKKFDLGEKLGKLTLEEMVSKGFKPIELGPGSASKGMQTTGYALYDEDNKNNLSNYYRMQKISKEEFEKAKELAKKSDTTKGGEDRGTKRQNKIKEMADKIKQSPDYNAEYAKQKINELADYKKFGKNYFDIDKQDLIKEGHGDALAYIGEIYGKEKGERNKKQDKGFSILRDLVHEDLTDTEKKWIADNSLTNTIAEAISEVISENCGE